MTLKLNLKSVKDIYYMFVYWPPDSNVNQFISESENKIYILAEKPNSKINIIGDTDISWNKTRDPDVKRFTDFLRWNRLVSIISYDTC